MLESSDLEVLHAGDASALRVPLVFVHGANVGAWCWQDYFLPYFARLGYPCLALSLRGHGRSPSKGFFPPGIAEYVADVWSVAQALSRPPIVIGHSMGARVVETYLDRHPASAAVLLAPVPSSGLIAAGFRMGLRDPTLVAHIGGFNLGWMTQVPLPILRRALFGPQMSDHDVLRHAARACVESATAIHEMSYPVFGPSYRRGRPMLVLGAGEDAFFDSDQIHATARHHGVEAEIIPGLPHALMLDPHWEQVARRVAAWLDELVVD